MELLVVITIIVILIALLTPAMDNAILMAERAKCLANQRNITQSTLVYAAQYRQVLPPHTMSTVNGVSSAYDLRTYNVTPRSPIGQGLLPAGGFLPTTQLGKIMHCPNLDTMNIPVGNPGHNMDVINGSGRGASWWVATDQASIDSRIIPGYNYRASNYYLAGGNATQTVGGGHMRLGKIAQSFVINVDILDTRVGINYHHQTGYNRSLGDGSAAWFSDPYLYVQKAILLDGAMDGVNGPAPGERAYLYLGGASKEEKP